MKKILFSISLIFLCSCQPAENVIVRNMYQKYFDTFWTQFSEQYVYLADKDYTKIYDECMSLLGTASQDSITLFLAVTETFIQSFEDVQMRAWTYGYRLEYQPYPCTGFTYRTSTNDVYYSQRLDYHQIGYDDHYFEVVSSDSVKFLLAIPSPSDVTLSYDSIYNDTCLVKHSDSKGLIIDLRGNGNMREWRMNQILAHVLPEKDVVVFYSRSRSNPKNPTEFSTPVPHIIKGRGTFADKPVALLVEKSTTGIANILSHAMSHLSNVSVISMSETGGGGALTENIGIAANSKGQALAVVSVPTYALCYEDDDFSLPLQPTIQIPYEEYVITGYSPDPYISAAINALSAH